MFLRTTTTTIMPFVVSLLYGILIVLSVAEGSSLRWRLVHRGNNTVEPLAVPSSRRIEMDCRIRGKDDLIKTTWLKDGALLSSRPHVRIRRGRLLILDSKVGDSGNYTCRVSNGESTLLHRYVVKVVHRVVAHRPIVEDSLPGNHTVLVGSNLTLLCDVEYVDILSSMTMAWVRHLFINGSYKNSQDGAANLQLLQNCSIGNSFCDFVLGNPNVTSARKLVLTNLQVSDSGPYSCIATDQYGFDLSTGMIIVVEELPEVAKLKHVRLVWIIIISTSIFLAVLTAGTCVLYWRAKSSRRKKQSAMSVFGFTKQIKIHHDGPHSPENNSIAPEVTLKKIRSQPRLDRRTGTAFTSEYEFDVDEAWELSFETLSLGGILGEGNFGKVLKGNLRDVKTRTTCVEVAVKMLKEGHTDSDVIDMVKEVEIMKKVGAHENILSLVGVCTQPNGSHPLWIIVEYARYGCLKTHLQKRQAEGETLSHSEMYSFSNQIAKGMNFLSQNKCVHRDLAARNILLADKNVIKIADFGMARNVIGKEYYRKRSNGKLPIKWMAPEAFFQNFYSTQSDVWSYGILLWEIASYGEQPYKEIFDHITLFKKLEEGLRLAKPPDCPHIFYDLMRYCWKYCPEERPSWTNLLQFTDGLLSGELENRYLALSPENGEEVLSRTPILGRDSLKDYYYVSPSSLLSCDIKTRSRPLSRASGYCDIELYSVVNMFPPFVNGYSNNVYGKLLNSEPVFVNSSYRSPSIAVPEEDE